MASAADNLLDVVSGLERQPLRNMVLLKQIEAFREHVSVVQVSDGPDTAIERPPSPDAPAARSCAGSRQCRVQACQ